MPPEARIWREEIFGPVLSVAAFKSEDEAMSLANTTEFGMWGLMNVLEPKQITAYESAEPWGWYLKGPSP